MQSINSNAQVFNREYINPTNIIGCLSIEKVRGDTVMILPLTKNLQTNRYDYSPSIVEPNGNLQSTKHIVDSTAMNYIGWANSLNPFGDSNFVFAGNIFRDTFLIGTIATLNSSGDTLWSRKYGTPAISYNVFHQARETNNGDIIAVGAHAYRGQRNDGWLVRTDSIGNVLWDKKYSTSLGTQEFLYSVQETYDGGFILGGQEQEFPNNLSTRNYDPILIKTDSAGNQQWRYRYDTPYDDPTNYCIQTFDSNYVCAGSYTYKVNGNSRRRPMLFKMSKSGQFMWKREYGPLTYGSFYIVKQLLDSTLIAVGWRNEPYKKLGVMVRARPNGDSIFVKDYEFDPTQTTNDNRLHDVVQMSDGGFMACGEVIHDQTFTNRQNPWLIRTDSNGCILSSCLVGVEEQEFEGESKRISVYPNPTNGKIQLSGLDERPLQMMLFDLQGREIKSFDPKQANWQLPEAKGMYLLRIQTKEGEWLNRKIIRE